MFWGNRRVACQPPEFRAAAAILESLLGLHAQGIRRAKDAFYFTLRTFQLHAQSGRGAILG